MPDTDLEYAAPLDAVLAEAGDATEDELLGDFADNADNAEEAAE